MKKRMIHWMCLAAAVTAFIVVPGSGQKTISPDLTITLTGPQQAVVTPNASLTGVTVRISNTGKRDATNFDISLALAETLDQSGWTGQVGRQHIAKLAQGISTLVLLENTRIPAGTPLKALYLIARVDSQNTVAEAREDNNTANLAVLAQMKITQAYQVGDSSVCIYIKGIGFGPGWENKAICFDGAPVEIPAKPPMNWSNTTIFFQPKGMVCGRTYSLSISNGGISVSNAVSIFISIAIGWPNPGQGAAGTAVTLRGQFGPAQGARTLKLGNVAVTSITSWSDGIINLHVPSGLAPGTYQFSVWEGTKNVSVFLAGSNKFTVI